jgi:Ni,Fe-hydrogenase III small subunit
LVCGIETTGSVVFDETIVDGLIGEVTPITVKVGGVMVAPVTFVEIWACQFVSHEIW